ncbi:sensor histidine kinase [Actinocorallia sp. API 0066]|uniref:sensor histidine kinase n=1 Tax=Actinocorallia sp. API 0066 TaxID=2896846 RepID=UPI001E60072C|nr:sensor histidine kinase [Actinocorallia sp. API 0066]MCD0452855.1 sensor histidine kinase [Actinocorallia sp. API 0066]
MARRTLLWAGAVAGPLCVLAAYRFRYGTPEALRTSQAWRPEVIMGVLYPAVGAFLLSRRQGLVIGRLLWAIGLLAAAFWLLVPLSRFALIEGWPGAVLLRWAASWIWLVEFLPLLMFVSLLFPDGRPPSRRWYPVLWVAAGLIAYNVVYTWLRPVDYAVGPHSAVNPFGLEVVGGLEGFHARVMEPITVAVAFLCIGSLAVRFKAGDAVARRQIGLMAYPLLGTAVSGFADMLWPGLPFWAFATLTCTAVTLVPIALSIGILRYRLYDLDVIVNRTLVYAALTVILGAVYFGLIFVVSTLVATPAAGLVGALIVGALFQPVRSRVQLSVDLMLGIERDPYRLADRLSRSVQRAEDPSAALAAAVRSVRRGLGVSGVAVEIDGSVAHTDGLLTDRPRTVPLVWHGEPIGRLLLYGRAKADQRLAGVLTRHVADLAHTVRLLRVSRETVINTREDERRRLSRDLHDGLGPTLAALALSVDTARIRLTTDPEAVEPALTALRDRMSAAIADIRELVHGLRPPALDRLGLLGAVRALAADLPEPRVDVVADELGELTPVHEMAVYRIVQEALTNVRKHAHATSAEIRLTRTDEHLELVVTDDGRGLPRQAGQGLGLTSMRERATELGGTFTIASRPTTGTTLTTRLPLRGR